MALGLQAYIRIIMLICGKFVVGVKAVLGLEGRSSVIEILFRRSVERD